MTRPSYPPRRSPHVGPGQVPRPVVALDIDGTLAAYHGHFLWFAGEYLGREMPPTYDCPGGGLAAFMGVSKTTYRRIKLAYRQSGLKRAMPAYPGASELTKVLRARGADVWICTTRPYLALSNIEPDSKEWAKRNGVQYDAFIFGENKYRDLVSLVGSDRIVAVLDDLPEMHDQAARLGLPAILRTQPYNRDVPYAWRADNLDIARSLIMGRIQLYEERMAL